MDLGTFPPSTPPFPTLLSRAQHTPPLPSPPLSWFANFQKAKPGNPLYDKGRATVPDLVGAFAADVASDSLPSVSILVGPAALSEHAAYHPSAGEDLTARIIKALVSNPAVYKKSAMLFNYDEGGQFFDHAVPYTIPLSTDGTDGESTVSTHEEDNSGLPIGPGFRVPFMAISPWSRGGYVVSELFDHTSCIRFLEKRFNISVPTISPWRRAMLGDLTSAFNFSSPDYTVDWVAGLPDTSGYPAEAQKECDTLPPPKAPAVQSFPVPYKGVRPSRALPYTLTTTATCGPSGLLLTWNNSGAAGMPLQVFDYAFSAGTHMPGPRKYAIEAGKVLSAKVPWPAPYSVVAHSVNGYARVYQGSTCEVGGEEVDVTYDAPNGRVVLVFSGPAVYNVTDLAYGTGSTTVTAPAGGIAWAWDASHSGNHYDFGVESGTKGWYRRAMGRMETGVESTSDPAMGTGAPALHPFTHPATHPELPEVYRVIERAQKLTPAQLKSGQKNEFHKDTTLSQRFDKEF
jgi:phospholipase C